MSISDQNIYTSNISFGILGKFHGYNFMYRFEPDYNGKTPDFQLLDFLAKYIQNIKAANIADIGAGNGRNAFPVSKYVNSLTAFEQSRVARSVLKNKAPSNNLFVSDKDITKDNFFYPANFDAVYMTHVTQHFIDKELVTTFQNLKNTIKRKGLLVFDALIWDSNPKNRIATIRNAKNGNQSFCQKDLLEVARSQGFSLVDTCNYEESGLSRAFYIDKGVWGGSDKNDKTKYPVKLKWFVFRLD